MADKRNILASLMINNDSDRENKAEFAIGAGSSAVNTRCSQAGAEVLAQQASRMTQNRNRPHARNITGSSAGIAGNVSGGGQVNQKQHKLKSRFTVIKKLGKGTYGKVQLAVNKETGQEVAIKTIKKTKIENDQDLQRVRREIQIMSSIEHPHIIHIYEVFENKDKIVLIMQYAPGGELFEYVSQSKVLDDSEARRLFRQIATAIYYCHQNKICHRDLKLENILLDEKNNAKLADFGLSNVFDKSRLLKTFCGSPLYASPEIVQGSPYEGPEVDCWSLGVLLFTLVYGAMPFDGSNFKRLVKQISGASYYEPPQKSQASPLIGRLLCADASRRATILDICSDPWVNGIMVQGSPRLSPTNDSNQQQTHPSLLKVAQDMANLTPVRLDILLALALDSNDSVEPKDSLPVVDKKIDSYRNQGANIDQNWSQNEKKSAQRPCLVAVQEPLLLETDARRTASPVANYIVRDIVKPVDRIVDANEIQLPQVNSAKIVDIQPKEDSCKQIETIDQTKDSDTNEMIVEPHEDTATETVVVSTINENRSEAITTELPKPDSRMSVDSEALNDVQIEIETVREFDQNSNECENVEMFDDSIAKHEVVEIPMDSMNTDVKSDLTPGMDCVSKIEIQSKCEPVVLKSETKINHDELAMVNLDDENKEKIEVQGGKISTEEKPKKVKKKIIVVKKKKKISKRESDMTKDYVPIIGVGGTKQICDQETIGQPKGPGKVKIPETFQPTGGQERQQTPPKATTTSRRQSALVADVSQKLMQQQQHQLMDHPSSGAAIEEDLQQLAGVRVSDKKSDFERKTSLAKITAHSSPVSASTDTMNGRKSSLSTNKLQSEPIACTDVKCEKLDPNQPLIQETIVEPVQHHDAQIAESHDVKKKTLNLPAEPSAETLWDDQTIKDIGGQPVECTNRLDPGDRSPSSLEATIVDERSDSVDTIKAELTALESPLEVIESPIQRKNIRSSLQIDLSQPQEIEQNTSLSSTSHCLISPKSTQAPEVGPAPIARSYKKVTFTKDGTCITETGRIYSTQGHDGTVRRIERKSKVTHYPMENKNEMNEKTHEEVVYENEDLTLGDNCQSSFVNRSTLAHQSGARLASVRSNQRPFERLIMSSSNFYPHLNENEYHCDNNDSRPQKFEARHASFQQRGRADSASSCSSESTDVFDDTFDTWTGAISMFNHQSRRLSELHNSIISQAFSKSPLHFHPSLFKAHHHDESPSQQRPHSGVPFNFDKHPSSATYRCGSVEPTFNFDASTSRGRRPNSRRKHDRSARRGATSDHGSGYESDVPFDGRPLSATGARGPIFGSSKLFPSHHQSAMIESLNDENFIHSDPLEADSLLRDLEMEHERLRCKIAKQREQLWRGSTSSLHGRAETSISRNQSSSSGQQLRQSVPLDAAPIRRNTANFNEHLPPRQPFSSMKRSTSRTSIITSKMNNIKIGGSEAGSPHIGQQDSKSHHSACFIELKRSSSSASRQQETRQQTQQQFSQHNEPETLNLKGAGSATASAFWDGRVTPTANSSADSSGNNQNHPTNLQENPDARIRNWLQQSSGNLSISSGSKTSSASETLASSSRSDPTQMFGVNQEILDGRHMDPRANQLPPAPSRSPSRQPVSRGIQGINMLNMGRWLDDSLSGSAADLESQSSSSLLDQLRSRGYRSMISQRIVSQQPAISEMVHHETQSSQLVTSTSSATSLLDTSGGTHYVTSSSIITSAAQQETVLANPNGQQIKTSHLIKTTSTFNENQQDQNNNIEQSRYDLEPRSDGLNVLKPTSPENDSTNSEDLTSQAKTESKSVSDHQEIATTSKLQEELSYNIEKLDKRTVHDNNDNQSSETNQGENNISLDRKQSSAKLEVAEENQGEPEDMDEDVREAKANIKEYLDRMRETEKFLKSLHEEEENQERRRQQVYLFNNLMLNTKMNGIRSATLYSTGDDKSAGYLNTIHPAGSSKVMETNEHPTLMGTFQSRSAPVWPQGFNFDPMDKGNEYLFNTKNCLNLNTPDSSNVGNLQSYHHEDISTVTTTNVSSQLSNNLNKSSQVNEDLSSVSCFSSDLYRPVDNYQPSFENSNGYPMDLQATDFEQQSYCGPKFSSCSQQSSPYIAGSWRRCKSQLGDQFSNSISTHASGFNNVHDLSASGTSIMPSRGPMSATIDSTTTSLHDTNPYFRSPRHRRSVSQLRQTDFGPVASLNNRYSQQQPIMSEYRSSFGPNLGASTMATSSRSPARRRATSPLPLTRYTLGKLSPTGVDGGATSDDSDAGMHAYRASSYVPKVVPEGGPSSRSRDFSCRRFGTSKLLASTRTVSTGYGLDRSSTNCTSRSPVCSRRISLELTNSARRLKEDRIEIDNSSYRSVSPIERRRSLTTGGGVTIDTRENSRLTELEQRIQANKKRREELLLGNYSGGTDNEADGESRPPRDLTPMRNRSQANTTMEASGIGTSNRNADVDAEIDDSCVFDRPSRSSFRDASPARASTSTQGGRVSTLMRPSRLESMEARIKRRSYCVRTNSPERSKSSSRWSWVDRRRQSLSTCGQDKTGLYDGNSSRQHLKEDELDETTKRGPTSDATDETK